MIATCRPPRLSPQEFAQLGIEKVAYVMPVIVSGMPAYAIHAADGAVLARASGRAAALTMVRQRDFEPVSVH
jgi:hypothetical protein